MTRRFGLWVLFGLLLFVLGCGGKPSENTSAAGTASKATVKQPKGAIAAQ